MFSLIWVVMDHELARPTGPVRPFLLTPATVKDVTVRESPVVHNVDATAPASSELRLWLG